MEAIQKELLVFTDDVGMPTAKEMVTSTPKEMVTFTPKKLPR